MVLLYGSNNPVDQVVLDVLIRKARKIRRDLGIAVPVPVDAEQVIQTVVDNVLLRGRGRTVQFELALETPDTSRLHEAWDEAASREKRQRGYFDQHGIKPEEVSREVEATDTVLGDTDAVRLFLADALQRFGGEFAAAENQGVFRVSPGNLKPKLEPFAQRGGFPIRVVFDRQKDPDALYLGRTHPLVARVCNSVLGEAFASSGDDRFARSGAMFTDAITRWTALLLLRFRYRFTEQIEEFAEEIVLAGFERGTNGPSWLEPLPTAARILAETAEPRANISREERSEHVARALDILSTGHKLVRACPGLASRRARASAQAASCPAEGAASEDQSAPAARHPRLLRSPPREGPSLMGHVAINIEGGLVSSDLLERIAATPELVEGQRAADFGVDGRLSEEIQSAFSEAAAYWNAFQARLHRGRESSTTITRETWILPLLQELGYELRFQRAALQAGGGSYVISHRYGDDENAPPIHVVASDQELDKRGSATQSPHATVQDFLNRSDALWGIVTNGMRLRLLRDTALFSKPSYIEFDLEGMMDGGLYSEFVLFTA